MLKLHFHLTSSSINVWSSGYVLEKLHFQTKGQIQGPINDGLSVVKRFIIATVPQTLRVCTVSTTTVLSAPAPSLGAASIFVQWSGLEKLIRVESQPFLPKVTVLHIGSLHSCRNSCASKKTEEDVRGSQNHHFIKSTGSPKHEDPACFQTHTPATDLY